MLVLVDEPDQTRGVAQLLRIDVASGLTPFELEVLGHVAAGLTDRETARRLGVSFDRVRHAVRGAIAHLAARTRSEAVYLATQGGLLDEGVSALEPNSMRKWARMRA